MLGEPWVKTDYHCLNCGSKTVWMRNDGGDYYKGEQHICSKCSYEWHLPNTPDAARTDDDLKRAEYLAKLEGN